jgi:Lysine methyltransferase
MAAACAWGVKVTLTDLPEVLPNLQSNINNNRKMIEACGGDACALPLDWSDSSDIPADECDRYSVILAADTVYSPEHPLMLADTVQRWMRRSCQACFVVELPLRDGYHQELDDLKTRLRSIGLQIAEKGSECGFDDRQSQSGAQTQVECWWALFHLC